MVTSILQQITLGQAPSLVSLSVKQYHEMIAQGILHEGAAIELIDGLLGAQGSSGPRR